MGIFSKLFGSRPTSGQSQIDELSANVQNLAFPHGQNQINEETAQLHALLRSKLSKSETQRLLVRTKRLLVLASDKSKARIVPSIYSSANGQLTESESTLIYEFLTGDNTDLYSGADGSSRENAIIINTTSSIRGVDAEYKWIESRYGQQDRDWEVKSRFHGQSKSTGRAYETFVIALSNDEDRTIHFDISSFYGR